jgi:hypothetical protein
MNLRSGRVSTIAGVGNSGYRDGPASQSQFMVPFGLAVSASGVIFVCEQNYAVRRISPPPRSSPTAMAADAKGYERVVETVVGSDVKGGGWAVQFARSSPPSFRSRISAWSVCIDPVADSLSSSAAADTVRLYVGGSDGVHVLALARGERTRWALPGQVTDAVTGLALTADRTRLFAMTPRTLSMFDTRTGAGTVLVAAPTADALSRSAHRPFVCYQLRTR